MEFLGYLRPNGTVGTRNYVLVIPTVNCINDAACQIASAVPGVKFIAHSTSCGHKEDMEKTRRGIVGMAKNPNIYAALFVGIGCEPLKAEEMAAQASPTGKPVLGISVEGLGSFDAFMEKGIEFVTRQFADSQACKRVPCDVSSLIVGTKCGGSGSLSALSNNPAIGRAIDMLIDLGGSAMFSETVETLGMEHIVAKRIQRKEDVKKYRGYMDRINAELAHHNIDLLGSEPTPGNIRSGLSTIEEKSLGAIMKGGTKPIVQVLDYAEAPTCGRGLYFMNSSALGDLVFAGAMAAGSQIGIFSVAGGLEARFRALPSSGSGIETYPALRVLGSIDDRDEAKYYDAYTGEFLLGEKTLDQIGQIVFDALIASASGKPTFIESHNRYYATINFYRTGIVL